MTMTSLFERITLPGAPGSARVEISCFQGDSDVTEYHMVVTAPRTGGFLSDSSAVAAGYSHALSTLGIGLDSAVLRRVFLSDIANQTDAVMRSPLGRPADPVDALALSLVGQPPVVGGRLALWAYHIEDPAGLRKRAVADGIIIERGANRHLWLTGLAATGAQALRAAAEQSALLLERFADAKVADSLISKRGVKHGMLSATTTGKRLK